jgi:hypothetical protein
LLGSNDHQCNPWISLCARNQSRTNRQMKGGTVVEGRARLYLRSAWLLSVQGGCSNIKNANANASVRSISTPPEQTCLIVQARPDAPIRNATFGRLEQLPFSQYYCRKLIPASVFSPSLNPIISADCSHAILCLLQPPISSPCTLTLAHHPIPILVPFSNISISQFLSKRRSNVTVPLRGAVHPARKPLHSAPNKAE